MFFLMLILSALMIAQCLACMLDVWLLIVQNSVKWTSRLIFVIQRSLFEITGIADRRPADNLKTTAWELSAE